MLNSALSTFNNAGKVLSNNGTTRTQTEISKNSIVI